MTIEDIPEMQVLKGFTGSYEPADFTETTTPRFEGDLLVLTRGKEFPHENYVIGMDGEFNTTYLDETFRHLAGKYAGEGYRSGWIPLFEARMSVNPERISVSGIEDKFPGYDGQVIRPIIERWAKQNLPRHSVDVK